MRLLSDESTSSLVFRLAQTECCTGTDFCRAHFGLSYATAHSDLDRLLVAAYAHTLAQVARVSTETILSTAIPTRLDDVDLGCQITTAQRPGARLSCMS